MIPTYNPSPNYLEQTLQSVLAQDPGAEQMQIEIVDDCSPNGAPFELVRRIAGDRVSVHREPKNNGLAGIWNRCIERARGEWVHILHQDDLVMPGFYERLKNNLQSQPSVGAAFCRHALIDENGHWLKLSDLHRSTAGILENWQEKIAVEQHIWTPAIVVRRAVYEKFGGYLPELCYVLDWEMWQRIAAQFPFWFEPEILAGYRTHNSSATSRLVASAADVRDVQKMIQLCRPKYPSSQASDWMRQAGSYYAEVARIQNRKLMVEGHWAAAWQRHWQTFKMSPRWNVFASGISLFFLQMRLMLSRSKRRLTGN